MRFSGTEENGIRAIFPDYVPEASIYSFFESKKAIETNFYALVGFICKNNS